MSIATNTKIQVKNVGENIINIYRDETKSETNGITYSGYGMSATKYNDDKTMMFVDAYGGWIETSNVTIIEEKPVGSSVDSGITIVPQTISTINIAEAGSEFDDSRDDYDASTLGTIFGIPYQFMSKVDRRIDDTGFGRKYREKIIDRDNFVYFVPGKQTFMPGSTRDEKANILANLADMAMGEASPDAILGGSGRYYGLEIDTSNYYNYVNAACRSVAILMDLGNITYKIGRYSEKLKSYNWESAKNGGLIERFGAQNRIVVYPDSLNSISEDFGNQTRESSLVSQVNGYSDTIKEINYFMTGSADSAYAELLQNESANAALSDIQNTINNFTGGQGVLQAMLGNSTTLLSGGKLLFPELWSDSDYDRSYSIDVKLRSPDADDLSIYINLIVPLIHLMALTAPRDFDSNSNSNGFVAPFLVKAYSRSLFNIELGIITSLNINKGGEGMWATSSNLPTSIDVSISVKDLYKNMYMSKVSGAGFSEGASLAKFVANDGEMEQLMNMAGVDLTNPSVLRKRFDLYGQLASNAINPNVLLTRVGNKAKEEFFKKLNAIFHVN